MISVRTAEFRLRHFAFAGNPQTGTAVSYWPTTIAPDGGDAIQGGEEEIFQRLDRFGFGNESATRN